MNKNSYIKYIKTSFDFLTSIILLIILSPLFLAILLVLYIQNNGEPFFIQERPGKNLKPFKILKFKTMNDKKDENGALLPDKDRLTLAGRLVRKTSVDELPQLINVIKGDMSLIGPRPLLFKYVPLYNDSQRRRHLVRPGITGWAQVNGRNSISWQRKFELDNYYVDHVSFLLDLRIFWLSIVKILKREGINQSAERPMEPFNGSN
jgi:lipopolysaccharide/colanic/teichoic acid biosynthesis glycosyltransferase